MGKGTPSFSKQPAVRDVTGGSEIPPILEASESPPHLPSFLLLQITIYSNFVGAFFNMGPLEVLGDSFY